MRAAAARLLPPAIRLPLALLLAVLLLAGGAVTLNSWASDHLLRADAERTAHAWADDLAARLPGLPALLDRHAPSPEALAMLEQARRVGDVFRYKLFDRAGNLVFISDDLNQRDLVSTLNAHRGNSDVAARIQAGQSYIKAARGTPPDRPLFYVEAYVPVIADGELTGVAEVYLDQTDKQALYRRVFLAAEAAVAALVLLAAILPAIVARRSSRERRAAEARVHFLAHHDPLTGLPNRIQFNQRLTEALARARRDGSHVAVLALDLDRFKDVNDTLGHATGDRLLQAAADRMRALVRQEDTVARLGGDEFAVVQVGVAQPDGAGRLADRLAHALRAPHDLGGHQVAGGASIGVAVAPGDSDDPETLLRHADTALYRAKADQRGSVRFFAPGMDAALQARRALEADLRQALATDGFQLHFQPIHDLPGRNLVGFEALLRWPHPTRGMVPPADFIPLAEDIGLIVPLGEWVLREACREAVHWPGTRTVAVNLSPAQFRLGDVVATVRAALADSGLPAARLELEITEGLLLQDTDTVLGVLTALRNLGVGIAMDDFGTGYSSLGYLWRFPFDKLKIDRSFVAGMEADPRVAAIVATIVGLGRTLHLTVTAEGIETEAQARALTDAGCDQAQGYLLGRPAPREEARRRQAEPPIRQAA